VSNDEPLCLSLFDVNGNEHVVTISGPGDGMRIAVGSLNRRGSVWRALANRNDVYLSAGGLGQSNKWSLHESGVWRRAYLTPEHAARDGAVGEAQFNHDPRVLDRWDEPEAAAGWMHALTAWVPHGHLTPLPDEVERPRKPITWVAEPEPGEMVGLHFAIVRPDEGIIETGGMAVVDAFRLPDGRAFVALTSRRPVEPSLALWHRDASIAALAMSQGNNIKHFGDPLRVGLFTIDDNKRAVVDLRAPQLEDIERAIREGMTVEWTYRPPHGE
jgi:hypothetical protein